MKMMFFKSAKLKILASLNCKLQYIDSLNYKMLVLILILVIVTMCMVNALDS